MARIRILRRGQDGVTGHTIVAEFHAPKQAREITECLGEWRIVDAQGVTLVGDDVLLAGDYLVLPMPPTYTENVNMDTHTYPFWDWKEDVVESRISRLTVRAEGAEEVCVGTAVRISADGLLVAPRNCLIDIVGHSTRTSRMKLKHSMERVGAFGGGVDVVASHPDSQIVLLQGQPGPAFRLGRLPPGKGDRVFLAGFRFESPNSSSDRDPGHAYGPAPGLAIALAAAEVGPVEQEEDGIDGDGGNIHGKLHSNKKKMDTIDIRPGYVCGPGVNLEETLGAADLGRALRLDFDAAVHGHGSGYWTGAAVLHECGSLAGVHVQLGSALHVCTCHQYRVHSCAGHGRDHVDGDVDASHGHAGASQMDAAHCREGEESMSHVHGRLSTLTRKPAPAPPVPPPAGQWDVDCSCRLHMHAEDLTSKRHECGQAEGEREQQQHAMASAAGGTLVLVTSCSIRRCVNGLGQQLRADEERTRGAPSAAIASRLGQRNKSGKSNNNKTRNGFCWLM